METTQQSRQGAEKTETLAYKNGSRIFKGTYPATAEPTNGE